MIESAENPAEITTEAVHEKMTEILLPIENQLRGVIWYISEDFSISTLPQVEKLSFTLGADAGDTDTDDTDAGDMDTGDTDAGDTDTGDTDTGDVGDTEDESQNGADGEAESTSQGAEEGGAE